MYVNLLKPSVSLMPASTSVARVTLGPRVEYSFSPDAAELLGSDQDVLIHHRLFNIDVEGVAHKYEVDGRGELVIYSEMELPDNPRPGRGGDIGRNNVVIVTPEEVREEVELYSVSNINVFPENKLLPFDIERLVAIFEAMIGLGYRSKTHPEAIIKNIDPLNIYKSMFLLSQKNPELFMRNNVLDLGSGLGIVSFIISYFMKNGVRVLGADFDKNMVIHSERFRRMLMGQFGYSFLRNVSFRLANVLEMDVSGFDALACSWFPITHGIPDHVFVEKYRELPEGALVFQFLSCAPVTRESEGFVPVEIGEASQFLHVFRRV